MHRVAELLGGRRLRIVVPHGGVVRLVAVRAPVRFHLSGIGIDHGDAFIGVAVGDVRFVGLGIDPDLATRPKFSRSLLPRSCRSDPAASGTSLLRELQDVGVSLPLPRAHVALVIDVDPVRPFRPLVARARAAQDLTRCRPDRTPVQAGPCGSTRRWEASARAPFRCRAAPRHRDE